MQQLRTIIKKIPGARWLATRLGLVPSERRGFLLHLFPQHSIGAEIGVHMGDFSQRMLDHVSPKELHLIDPWEHHTSAEYRYAWYGGAAKRGQDEMDLRYASVCNRFSNEIDAGRVEIHRGYSKEVLEKLPDEYLDWIYIDGNHLYEYVLQDLELSLTKTKPGGLITGDDYTEGGWWQGGVKKAVDEFAGRESVDLVEVRHRQFIFRKKA